MERRRRDLEGDAGGDEDDAEDDAEARRSAVERRRDALEGDRAGEAVDERGAVEQHPGGERPEDEVLQPGLGRAQIVAVEGGDDVGRKALQLEAEIERDEVVRRDHHQHADRRQHDEDAELEAVDALAAQIVLRHDDRGAGAEERQDLHELREAVDDEGAVEGRDAPGRQRQHGDERGGEETQRQEVDEPGRALAAVGADEDEHERAEQRG